MKYKRMKRSGRRMLIAALVGLLPLSSMTPLAATPDAEGQGAAGPLRQEGAAMLPTWHDDAGLNLRPEQFEAYGLTGPEWESKPEERGAAGPLRWDDAAMAPRWHDDSGLNLRGEEFEPYGFTGWKWE